MHFEDVPLEWLRAWADSGIISVAEYVAEVERRNAK